jgi:hypothetical protein
VKKREELDVEIRELEQELSEAVKGAERINELLVACLIRRFRHLNPEQSATRFRGSRHR